MSNNAVNGSRRPCFRRKAEDAVCQFREKPPFEIPLIKGLLGLAILVRRDDSGIAVVGKKLRRDVRAGIHDNRIDQKAVTHAVDQRIAECRLAANSRQPASSSNLLILIRAFASFCAIFCSIHFILNKPVRVLPIHYPRMASPFSSIYFCHPLELPYSRGSLKSLCFYLTAFLFIYYVTIL